ncbi:MAG: methyltransferase domain-containing protein [Candidatus Taylorbacteria bacterium]|nr:methyltransferase domain-containing protein [Candidatus Taylorbacteria bacterium]
MNEYQSEIKLAFITGLRDIVLDEISRQANLHVLREEGDSLYLSHVKDLSIIKHLRSVARAYMIVRDLKYNPLYISNHKSILGDLVKTIIDNKGRDTFETYKITCAGSDSKEVREINRYVKDTYDLIEKDEADIKIHIIKLEDIWEVGVQITARPLSVRDYKVKNMSGAMDPTIAFAVNSLCGLDSANSYLNVFSGSATLLIEAAQCYPKLETLVGFDNDKKHISLAIQNIKKAGLMEEIQLKEEDIFDKPDLGKFDVITSDLPFGMVISKNEDLNNLYQYFVEYCQETLNQGGKIVIYTSEHEIFEKIILNSKFKIIETLNLKFTTSVNSYLRPKIFVCGFK